MMARYFAADDDAWAEVRAGDYLSKDVHEPEPVKTGILDKDGRPIFRTIDPIGFVRRSAPARG